MSSPIETATGVFAGRGETRRLARELDWSATSLGPVEQWPTVLRTIARTVMDSPFPMTLWCGADRILIYNDGYRHVLGAKHPSALGRPGSEVWAEIWPHVRRLLDGIADGGPPVLEEDEQFVVDRSSQEERSIDDGGDSNAWFTYSLSPVTDDEGDIVALLAVVFDTTSRVLAEREREAALAAAERAEAQLRDVFEQAPAFMATTRGPDLVFEYVNDAFYKLVGNRDLVGRPLSEALPEVRGQGIQRVLHDVMEADLPFVGREVSLFVSRTPAGPLEERFADFVYYPMHYSDGTTGVVAHGYDVTEHVLVREEAKRARAEAEEANRAKSQFLANMSHEIRTPINAVVGYTDLLDAQVAGELTERQQEFVERIRASSTRLLALVDDVLDLSKIETGEMMLHTATLHVRDVVSSAMQSVMPEAEARGLSLREDWQCAERSQFVGDEDRTRQVLLNLLSNALKFTSVGGTVIVRCRLVPRPAPEAALPDRGPWVVIDVQDTGPGISPEDRNRIFHAFVQGESGDAAGGTGLGLTISRRLARLMSGDLTLRSEPDRGSCFSLWLPAPVQDHVQWGAVPEPEPSPRDVDPFTAVGQAVLESTEHLERELVWRLCAQHRAVPSMDATTPAGEEVAIRARFADHTAALLAGIGRSVASLEDPEANHALLEDGRVVRQTVASRHGAQRRRLGWSRADIEHEYSILRQTIEAFVQNEGPRRTDRDIAAALDAVHRFIDEARAASLQSFDTI